MLHDETQQNADKISCQATAAAQSQVRPSKYYKWEREKPKPNHGSRCLTPLQPYPGGVKEPSNGSSAMLLEGRKAKRAFPYM